MSTTLTSGAGAGAAAQPQRQKSMSSADAMRAKYLHAVLPPPSSSSSESSAKEEGGAAGLGSQQAPAAAAGQRPQRLQSQVATASVRQQQALPNREVKSQSSMGVRKPRPERPRKPSDLSSEEGPQQAGSGLRRKNTNSFDNMDPTTVLMGESDDEGDADPDADTSSAAPSDADTTTPPPRREVDQHTFGFVPPYLLDSNSDFPSGRPPRSGGSAL